MLGGANVNVVGSRCLVAVGSHGESMGAWWMKTRSMAGLAVPGVVGVVYVVPSGSVVTPEGGDSAGTVALAGGCDTLALRIASLVVGVGASWGASCGP